MAQLFTVYFPKYCFEVQQEFEINFPCASNLPFTPDVSKDGITHIKDINYNKDIDDADEIQKWMNQGLKPGLRIIEINGNKLVEERSDGAGNDLGLTSSFAVCTNNTLINKINRCGDGPITITVREEVPLFDDSESLGLEYKHQEEEEEETKSDCIIEDNQISVSSYDEKHDRTKCRLNTRNNHWSPNKMNENSRDVWICFDLKDKKLVDKIYIQGDEYHNNYVQEIWIDYSHDGCLWKSHPFGCIKCKYINSNNSLHNIPELIATSNDNNVDLPSPLNLNMETTALKDIGNKNNSEYDMAIIRLWPAINARFIRIRPVKWKGHCSMRIELLGNDRPINDQQFGRIVTIKTVNPKYKQQLEDTLRNKCNPNQLYDIENKKAIQVDCKSVVDRAMEVAGCSSYSVIEQDEDDTYLLLFTTSSAATSERVMDSLAQVGVGQAMGVISATPLEWRNAAKNEYCKLKAGKNGKPTGFYASVKSHQAIQVVVKRIMGAAEFTFDYICMLTVASCIAVAGLATDSPVIVVASMLVSPIMGPVLAFTFGVTLKEWHMARLGIRNEIRSLCICVVLGILVGFGYAFISQDRYAWPTNEMASRGNPWSLIDGAYIAAFSGVGVALSVLGDYLSTVVGVAISASLLPPAVNCGMLLALTIYELLLPQNVSEQHNAKDIFIMSIISLALTIENIFIIFGTARLMFLIKNVVKTNDHNQQTVWDSVSDFTKFHRLKKGLQRGYGGRDIIHAKLSSVDFDGNIDDDPDYIEGCMDVTMNEYHDKIDIYTKPGSDANKSVNAVRDTYIFSTDSLITDTLKDTILRQATRHYEYDNIVLTDEEEIELGDNTSSKRNIINGNRSKINKIFSSQQQLPLIEKDDNKIAIEIIDEDDDIDKNDTEDLQNRMLQN